MLVRWPASENQGVYVVEPGDTDDDEELAPTPDASSFDEASDELPVVYLAEGSQLGYLPKPARDAIGW